MANFDSLLKRRSSCLDKQLGETWYVNEVGSSVFTEIRVLLNVEADASQQTNQVVMSTQTKTLTVYKSPTTTVGGKAMGGIARPIIDRHQFISEADAGDPKGVFWMVKEIVGDDANTWTLRCERSQIQRVGTTNVRP